MTDKYGAQWYRDMAEHYEDVARNATSERMREANLAEAKRYNLIAERLEGNAPKQPGDGAPAAGSLLMDREHTSYRAIGLVNGLPYYIRQTMAGAHDMTSRLPEDAYYVFDAGRGA